MSNISSSNISVFPSTKRGNYQRSARLISESNLVGIVNRLLDSDKFVITQNNVSGLAPLDSPFELNIHGYYFNIKTCSTIIDAMSSVPTNSIWANIVIGTTDEYSELMGQDSGGGEESAYSGISFSSDGEESDTLPAGQQRYSLKILEKSGALWTIPSDSTVKYSSTRFFGEIDGGVI